MLKVGDAILYGAEGVCKIAEVREMKIGGEKGSYYVLRPIFRDSATIYVPTSNEALLSRMRNVLTRQEIDEILRTTTHEEIDWIDDPGQRKTAFSNILVSGDRSSMVRMIRTLYLQKRQLNTAGRHLRTGDDQILRDAEKIINDEFALVLNIAQQDVPDYIRDHVVEE